MSKVLDLWSGMTGTVLPFAGASAPNGWLLCYGQAVSRTDYPNLFAAIGTTYGTGDGSTTFNLPDLRGRVPAGKDNMGGTPANRLTSAGAGITGTTLGAAGGSQSHTLDATQIPAHNHTGTTGNESATHTHSGTTGTESNTHTHNSASYLWDTGSGNTLIGATGGTSGYAVQTSTANNTSHTHAFSTGGQSTNHTHSFTTANTGGGTAHNNTQPTIVLNHIIKA